jgi:hypothetical protein
MNSSEPTTKRRSGQRGKGSPYDKWCFLRNSEQLRIVLNQKIKNEGLKPYRVARKAGVKGHHFLEYLDGSVPKAVSQHKLWRICQIVGVDIQLTITLK